MVWRRHRYLETSLLFLVVLAGFWGCSQSPEAKREKHLARGQQYLASQKLDEALFEFQAALQADPHSTAARMQLGRAYQQKGWARDAWREFQRAVELQPELLEGHLERAAVALELGAVPDAEKAVEAALKLDAGSARGLALKGMLLTRKAQFPEALALLQQALRASPQLAEGHLGLGDLYRAQGKAQEASAAYQQATALHPTLPDGHVGLGVLAAAANRADEAERHFQAAVEARPTHVPARLAWAQLLVSQGKHDQALQQLEALPPSRIPDPRVVIPLANLYNATGKFDKTLALMIPFTKVFPDIADGHFALGEAYLMQNKLVPAQGAYREALARVPGNPRVQFRLAQSLARAGQSKEALALFTEVSRSAPDTPGLRLELASTYLRLGRLQDALRESRAAVQSAPDDTRPYELLGRTFAAMQDYEKALGALSQGLAIDATSLATHVTKARVLELQGSVEAADAEYRAAIAANPNAAGPRLALLQSLLRRRQWDSALQEAQAAVQMDPKSAPLTDALGIAYLAKGNQPEAEKAFRKALEIDSGFTPSLRNLARLAVSAQKTR